MSTTNTQTDPAAVEPIVQASDTATTRKRRVSRRIAVDTVALIDAVGIAFGFILPAIIYHQAGDMVTNWMLLGQAAIASAIMSHMYLRLKGMYAPEKVHDIPFHPGTLLVAVIGPMIILMGLGVPHAIREGHLWIWFAVATSGALTAVLMNRAIAHPLLARMTRAGMFDVHVAVFGAGQIARRVKEHLSEPEAGIHFAGVYDDRMGDDRLNPEGLQVAGRLDELINDVRADKIDKIVIALPQSADQRIIQVARKLEALPVSLHVVTHISSDLVEPGPAHKVSAIGSVGLLDIKKNH